MGCEESPGPLLPGASVVRPGGLWVEGRGSRPGSCPCQRLDVSAWRPSGAPQVPCSEPGAKVEPPCRLLASPETAGPGEEGRRAAGGELCGPRLWLYSDTPGHGFEGCGGRALQHPSPLGGQLVATVAGFGVPGGRVSLPSRSTPGVSVPEERRSVGVFPGSRRSAIAMDPSPARTASAGAGHGSHGGLAPRRAWARAAVGISQEVPVPGGPDGPKPRGRGGRSRPVLASLDPGRAGQAPGARIPGRRCALAGRGAGQRVSWRGAGGEVASLARSSHLSAASQWVSDACRAGVLGPAPSEGPCPASRTVSDINVRWAGGRALQDPCLGRARPVGTQGVGDMPRRPQAAHLDRAAE